MVESLHQLRKMVPKDVTIEIRSDGGLEFNNATVREYCNKNQIAGGHPNLKDGVCKGRPPLSWNCLVFYDKTSLT